MRCIHVCHCGGGVGSGSSHGYSDPTMIMIWKMMKVFSLIFISVIICTGIEVIKCGCIGVMLVIMIICIMLKMRRLDDNG